MKVLVTGGCGQLGMSLRRSFAAAQDDRPSSQDDRPSSQDDRHSAQDDNVILNEVKNLTAVFSDVIEAPDTTYLDITDLQAVRELVAKENVEAIINCAAYTNVEAAEDNYDLAERLNAKAVENLAVAMREAGGLLVHISTDYVFGKEPYNTPCKEDQKGTPTGVYGLTKLHGEEAILHSGVRHVIIRTAWLYSEYCKNFVKTMLQLTATKPSLKVVFDQVGTPTYAGDLAAAIMTILGSFAAAQDDSPSAQDDRPSSQDDRPSAHDDRPSAQDEVCHSERSEESHCGIFNYSNEGVCSWYDFAKAIAEYSGHASCDIRPCHSGEFPSKVLRPAYSVLDKTKIKETFGLRIPYWVDSLKECLSKML